MHLNDFSLSAGFAAIGVVGCLLGYTVGHRPTAASASAHRAVAGWKACQLGWYHANDLIDESMKNTEDAIAVGTRWKRRYYMLKRRTGR